jgi:hypothetical protein
VNVTVKRPSLSVRAVLLTPLAIAVTETLAPSIGQRVGPCDAPANDVRVLREKAGRPENRQRQDRRERGEKSNGRQVCLLP